MSYQYHDFNVYGANSRVDWASTRGWLIVVIFVALVGDFSWLSDYQPPEILPGSPEYQACLKDLTQTGDSFKATIETGKISIEEGVEYQVKIWSLRSKLSLDTVQPGNDVVNETRRVFVNNWQPTAETPEWIRIKIKTEEDRRNYGAMYFDSVWFDLQLKARQKYENLQPPTDAQIWAAARIVAAWLVKWYFLLTCPVFLIVLLNKKDAGSSIKEELLLQPLRWLCACLCGPIGLACISETAAKVTCFKRFRNEYLAEHPDVDYISPAAEAAIWHKVEQPLLSFDEAIASLKSGKAVRKPALACLLVWLVSVHHSPAAIKSVTAPIAVYLITAFEKEDRDITASDGGHHPLLLAILPQSFEIPMPVMTTVYLGTKWSEVRSVIRLTESPRGPPIAVREQPQEIISLSLDCITQKRG